jgi:hypothetical protein
MTLKTCTLRASAGAGVEARPGEDCSFWEHGCLVEHLEVPLEPELSRHLLAVRLALEDGRAREERETRTRLATLLNLSCA